MRRLSSRFTWFYKWVMPLLALGVIAFLGFVLRSTVTNVIFIALFVIAIFLSRKIIRQLADRVDEEGDFLLVRTGKSLDSIWIGDVAEATCTALSNVPQLTLRLSKPGRFGDTIRFLAPLSLSGLHFIGAFRLVDEITARSQSARDLRDHRIPVFEKRAPAFMRKR